MSDRTDDPTTSDEYLQFIAGAILDTAKRTPPPNTATSPLDSAHEFHSLASNAPSTQTYKWRVYAISDLHADMKQNMRWVESLPKYPPRSALIVAGDVATAVSVCRKVFETLKQKFEEVFWCFGNHELWLPASPNDATKIGYPDDSLGKLKALIDVCCEIGIRIAPTVLPGTSGVATKDLEKSESGKSESGSQRKSSADVLIVPILGWYDDNFGDSYREYTPEERDFDAGCKWPGEIGVVGEPRNSHAAGIGNFFQSVNRFIFSSKVFENLFASNSDTPVVTYSHFVPLRSVYRGTTRLSRVMGSDRIGELAFKLGSNAHVFGHSHVNADDYASDPQSEKRKTVRFVQNALGYPNERWLGNGQPKLVWPGEDDASQHNPCASS